jgi:hypothetical protein
VLDRFLRRRISIRALAPHYSRDENSAVSVSIYTSVSSQFRFADEPMFNCGPQRVGT